MENYVYLFGTCNNVISNNIILSCRARVRRARVQYACVHTYIHV